MVAGIGDDLKVYYLHIFVSPNEERGVVYDEQKPFSIVRSKKRIKDAIRKKLKSKFIVVYYDLGE